ncbi:malate dehydrogenase-like [Melitaea cinxia]|uniref:malate dehydrogenase-like n=1 Tax=Melitaea cinxia TaxID=113334 RepID=UPI001E26FDB0|nr:malate dehydrogenase-like [Melitaea cinxia]
MTIYKIKNLRFYPKTLLYFYFGKILSRNYHVTIVGGGNEVGQSVALSLRTQPLISKLIVHDTVKHLPGIVLDLSHIPSNSAIEGYVGNDTLESAIQNSDLIIATGVTENPGLSAKAAFNLNIDFIKTLATCAAKVTPVPLIGIVTEPINILVPMAAEVMRNNGEYDPRKLFGITGADFLKAKALYATENNLKPENCTVPVIGGHSKETVIPLLSQVKPSCNWDQKKMEEFTVKFRSREELTRNVMKGWSPILSTVYSVSTFVQGICDALQSRPTILHAYVENNDFGTSYFAGLLNVDQNGAGEMQRYSNLSQFECDLLERCIEQLRKDVVKGKKILEYA